MAEEAKNAANNVLPHKGHHHNPDAPHRNRYPADYDSTSDYEVRKLGDVLKSIDSIKTSIEECKKSINTSN
jgi:hypothetical protein